jgi:uncharacterized protein YgiM (DUF1202 family)
MKRIIIGLFLIIFAGSLLIPSAARAVSTRPDLEKGPAQESGGIIATVKVERLNVRRIPRLTGSVLGVLTLNVQVPLVGRTLIGDWLEAQTAFGAGWIDARYVRTNITILALPVTEGLISPFATVVSSVPVLVRTGPFPEYPIVITVYAGTELDVVGLHSKNTYVQVETPNGVGWIPVKTVRTVGNLRGLPVTDHTVLPLAKINGFRVSTDAPVVATARLGQLYTIIARDETWTWFQIQGRFGTGWVQAPLVVVIGYLDALGD